MTVLNNIKKWTQSKLKYYGGLTALIVYSVYEYLKDKRGRKMIHRVLTMQIYFTGSMALKIVGMVALVLGALTMIQLFSLLSSLGAMSFVGQILNIVIVRELGPIITAIIVISRSGTAIAAEIATMNINDEMNAIEMTGIDTLKFIIFPRIMGMVISMILLLVYFTAVGLIGGFVVGNLLGGVTFDMFMRFVMTSISFADIIASLTKGVVFGFFISAISIYYGFQAISPTQVPQVTTQAVMSSIFATFFLDIIITVIFYIR